jgi:SAM-dependent methyltransferase
MIGAMLNRLQARIRREQFLCSPLAIVISNIYIIRSGLYKSILRISPSIKGVILDFGCGSKPYESLFVNASSYTGVDIEVSGHSHEHSKVDVYYDGKTLPFPDEHFDAVVSFEVFEHVFNIDETLREIRRVLKPGGQILITTPFAWDEHEIPYDFARYTSYGIRNILERNSFDVLEIKKTTTYVLTVCQMFIAYLTQHVLPKNKILSKTAQLFLVFPLNIVSLFLDVILPKRYEYFCNSVVLGRRQT